MLWKYSLVCKTWNGPHLPRKKRGLIQLACHILLIIIFQTSSRGIVSVIQIRDNSEYRVYHHVRPSATEFWWGTWDWDRVLFQMSKEMSDTKECTLSEGSNSDYLASDSLLCHCAMATGLWQLASSRRINVQLLTALAAECMTFKSFITLTINIS